uniref:NADH dehydrogenase subunit 4L n=1 Tax=Schmidtea mediterranea TaxID=79327 RepID=A0A0B4VK92_SCHMD|nr:NADH dehydrogenase subunit 4L [Schmidtea mediterranea]
MVSLYFNDSFVGFLFFLNLFFFYCLSFRVLKFFLFLELCLLWLYISLGLSLFSFGFILLLYVLALFVSESAVSFSVLVNFLHGESSVLVSSQTFTSY